MDFLDAFTSAGASKPTREQKKDWKTKNAKTLIEGAHLMESTIPPAGRTMRVLRELKPETITPKKDKSIHVRTQAEINMIGAIIALLQADPADEVVIATYTLNKEALDILCELIDAGRIKNLKLMMASSVGFRDPKQKELMIKRALERRGNFQLSFAYSHFKITTIKTGGNYYHIEGSMNYSRNNAAENIVISNCKKLYDFDHHFICNIMLDTGHKAVEIIC